AILTANVGETTKITCSGSSYGNYSWFQQKVPDSGPVTVIYQNDKRLKKSGRHLGMPSLFFGSTSGTTGTLTITEVQ
ncbi:LV1 protein, partial [Pomatorhinus ruficollis]|nr:LV1 protein [Pomatorhinus ruficollis]